MGSRRLPTALAVELVTCLAEACDFTERNALALDVPGPTIKALTRDWRMVLAEAKRQGFLPTKETLDGDD